VVRRALGYLGTRYRYGASGARGFDCSGFTSYIYRQHGISLPHNSAAQYRVGKPVSRSELRPGDLVFFRTRGSRISHVGIYIGNGKFVHASSARGRVRIDTLTSGYYHQRYVGARRITKK
jgi:cell wall-associated NlpC family hydrolase